MACWGETSAGAAWPLWGLWAGEVGCLWSQRGFLRWAVRGWVRCVSACCSFWVLAPRVAYCWWGFRWTPFWMVWDLPDVAVGPPSFGVGLSLHVWCALVRMGVGTWWVRAAAFFSPLLCGSLSLGVTNWFAFFLPPFRVLLWLFFRYFQGFCFCLFIGCTGSSSLLRLSLVAESGGYSLVVVRGALFTAVLLLWTTGSGVCVLQQLQLVGSAVVHRLGFSMACGIFQDQGSNLCLLHWQADSSPLDHQGSPPGFLGFSWEDQGK